MIVPGAASNGHVPAGATVAGAPIAVATPAPSSATASDALRTRVGPAQSAARRGARAEVARAEQYRACARVSRTPRAPAALRTVLVTSPQKGEGKSVTSANLALTMAQELQRRVIIVEADLRKPSMQQLFGLPPGPGLAEYLCGGVRAE